MANMLLSEQLEKQGELSIRDIVDAVSNHFCLPSFQRGVVWSKGDIADLFDSLYKGFPVGNLLLWELKTIKDRGATAFYKINTDENSENISNTRSIKNFFNEPNKRFCVIDGQQRITALYRGLTSKYFVETKPALLFFNLLYDWSEPSAFRYYSENGYVEEKHLWIPVRDIWKRIGSIEIDSFLKTQIDKFSNKDEYFTAVTRKRKTSATVRKVDSVISYFKDNQELAKENLALLLDRLNNGSLPYTLVDLNNIQTQNNDENTIEKLFEVFVRLNNTGKPINPTDILFAKIAKNSSDDSDIWDCFNNALRKINDKEHGYSKFTKDHILRFLWLAYRQGNESFGKFYINRNRPIPLKMDQIAEAFIKAKQVFVEGKFSFGRKTPYSVFLPIAYYFYYNGSETPAAKAEIERYYEVAIVSDAFGQSTDRVMAKISEAIGRNNKNNVTLFGGSRDFNFTVLISKIREIGGSFFDVSIETVDSILDLKYDKNRDRIKQILFLLSRKIRPDGKFDYDVDHMHPKKYADAENEQLFFDAVGPRDEKAETLYEFYKEHVNDFSNLQLLDEYGNRGEKNDKLLVEWLKEYRKPNNLHEYAVNNYVCGEETPDGMPSIDFFELNNFESFYNSRKKTLRKALMEFFEISSE